MREPEPPASAVTPVPPGLGGLLVREWTLLLFTIAAALPAPVLRVVEVSGLAHPDLPPLIDAIIFGLGIFAAATLLTWASEVAETEVSAGLALVVLALIAVLPEYAVDLYFAIKAPHFPECISPGIPLNCLDPHPRHLAVANMTGGNRLLVGLAWPAVFLVFFLRTRSKEMPVIKDNALGILFLAAATIYSFSIPIRGHLSLVDTAIMFSLFAAYMYLSSRSPPQEERVFVGPAAAIAALPQAARRLTVLAIFVYAAGVIFGAAQPFADSLVETGKQAGIDQFVLVQWVAPLASESPEFILAGLLAMRGRQDAGMTILISSKVNQWTLLIGSLPLAYAISGAHVTPLAFDARQSEEIFLTAGQSLFAVAILFSLSMNRWEALLLAGLFFTQLVFTDTTVRLGYAAAYTALALFILARDRRSLRPFFGAAGDAAFRPGAHREAAEPASPRPP
jgi:cation:H+ antiporter